MLRSLPPEWCCLFFLLMVLAYGFIKLSILCFYRRIFAVGNSTFTKILCVAIVLVVMWSIGFFLVEIFSCGKRFNYNWGPLVDELSCVGGLAFLEGLMVSDFVSDVLIIFLPFPLIWRLHMSAQRKAAVTSSICSSASITNTSYTTKTDIFLTITTILYWSMIEAGIAVIALNLPTLQIFFAKSSLQSIVASVRSAISLESLRSQSSHRSRTSSKGTLGPQAPHSPYAEIHGVNPITVATNITEETNRSVLVQPIGTIHVEKDISQVEAIV